MSITPKIAIEWDCGCQVTEDGISIDCKQHGIDTYRPIEDIINDNIIYDNSIINKEIEPLETKNEILDVAGHIYEDIKHMTPTKILAVLRVIESLVLAQPQEGAAH